MEEKSVSFHVHDNNQVTVTLRNSGRLSLSDITAATIGNLNEDPQWAENSDHTTESGVVVLRPWEDALNTSKGNNSVQCFLEAGSPPTYHEHLKRHLDDDESTSINNAIKRKRVETISFQNEVSTHDALVNQEETTTHNATVTSTTDISALRCTVATKNSTYIVAATQNAANTNNATVVSYAPDTSNTASIHIVSGPQTVPTTRSAFATTSTGTSGYEVPLLQSTSEGQMLQNQNTPVFGFKIRKTTEDIPKPDTLYSALQSLQPEFNSDSKGNFPTTYQQRLPAQLRPNQILVQNNASYSQVQQITDQTSENPVSPFVPAQSMTTRNLQHQRAMNASAQQPFFNLAMQQKNNSEPVQQTAAIQSQQISSSVQPCSTPGSIPSASSTNYLPWHFTGVNVPSTKLLKPSQQNSTETSPSSLTVQLTSLPHNLPYLESATMLRQPKEQPCTFPQEYVPKTDAWDIRNMNVNNDASSNLLKFNLSPAVNQLQISDILQTKSLPESERQGQYGWKKALNTSQPTPVKQESVFELNSLSSTPVGKNHFSAGNYSSPIMESRFTESLSNLLGSPPPDSPLSKHPFLTDLQSLLTTECKREIVPQSLFSMQNKQQATDKPANVFERERNLQERFTKLQSSFPDDVRQLSSMFRYQSALIETERFRTLHECQFPGTYRDSINHHYDNQLHKVMDRVERSVELLETSNKENRPAKGPKVRPHFNKESVRLMESWYQQNLDHPYPTNSVVEMLAQAGNIGTEQVKKWFANKRNRNSNTRSLTEIAMQKRKLGHLSN